MSLLLSISACRLWSTKSALIHCLPYVAAVDATILGFCFLCLFCIIVSFCGLSIFSSTNVLTIDDIIEFFFSVRVCFCCVSFSFFSISVFTDWLGKMCYSVSIGTQNLNSMNRFYCSRLPKKTRLEYDLLYVNWDIIQSSLSLTLSSSQFLLNHLSTFPKLNSNRNWSIYFVLPMAFLWGDLEGPCPPEFRLAPRFATHFSRSDFTCLQLGH